MASFLTSPCGPLPKIAEYLKLWNLTRGNPGNKKNQDLTPVGKARENIMPYKNRSLSCRCIDGAAQGPRCTVITLGSRRVTRSFDRYSDWYCYLYTRINPLSPCSSSLFASHVGLPPADFIVCFSHANPRGRKVHRILFSRAFGNSAVVS